MKEIKANAILSITKISWDSCWLPWRTVNWTLTTGQRNKAQILPSRFCREHCLILELFKKELIINYTQTIIIEWDIESFPYLMMKCINRK